MNSSPVKAGSGRDLVRGVRWLLTYGAYPVAMAGAGALGATLLEHGLAPKLLNPLLIPFAFGSVTLLERVHPYRAAWNEPHGGDVRTDAGYFFVTSLTVLLGVTAVGALLLPLAGRLSARAPFLVWPSHWPLSIQVALALLVAEFGHYWVHRLQHDTDVLWRFHAVHHSAPRLYWLNASRFHPVDMLLSTVAGFGSLTLLGCPQRVIALFTLVGAIHNIFQHSNVDVRLGPLNYVFSMAELHRWHHSKDVTESSANYGGHLAVWDVLFGTRFLPKDRPPPEALGLADLPQFPFTLAGQLAAPFRFEEIRAEELQATES
jgi:sterol desaturase/sphingolipid hydroxylase (fatty acid hydroxylase superfamily)